MPATNPASHCHQIQDCVSHPLFFSGCGAAKYHEQGSFDWHSVPGLETEEADGGPEPDDSLRNLWPQKLMSVTTQRHIDFPGQLYTVAMNYWTPCQKHKIHFMDAWSWWGILFCSSGSLGCTTDFIVMDLITEAFWVWNPILSQFSMTFSIFGIIETCFWTAFRGKSLG